MTQIGAFDPHAVLYHRQDRSTTCGFVTQAKTTMPGSYLIDMAVMGFTEVCTPNFSDKKPWSVLRSSVSR